MIRRILKLETAFPFLFFTNEVYSSVLAKSQLESCLKRYEGDQIVADNTLAEPTLDCTEKLVLLLSVESGQVSFWLISH